MITDGSHGVSLGKKIMGVFSFFFLWGWRIGFLKNRFRVFFMYVFLERMYMLKRVVVFLKKVFYFQLLGLQANLVTKQLKTKIDV
jgi:hypothetical protein